MSCNGQSHEPLMVSYGWTGDMKTVLILTYSFPPDNRIAALRPFKLARCFLERGWRVIVLRSQFTGALATAPKDLAGIEVCEYRPGFLSRWFAEPAAAGGSVGARISSFIRRASRRMYLPEHSWALKRRVRRATEQLLQKNDVNCLVSISFPFVFHEIGREVKDRHPKIIWVADNRDMWSGNPYRGFQLAPKSWEEKIESACLSRADLVAGAAMSTTTAYRVKYGLRSTMTVLNGFEGDVDRGRPVAFTMPERLSFVHTGSLYGGRRDLSSLLRALEVIGTEIGAKCEVELYGEHNEAVARLSVPDNVCLRTHERISLEESHRVQAEADFLIVAMAKDDFDRTYVPAKVFEYAKLDKPVIALCHEGSDLHQLVSEYDLGIATFDSEAIVDFIKKYCLGNVQIRTGADVRLLSAKAQFSRMIEFVEGALDEAVKE